MDVILSSLEKMKTELADYVHLFNNIRIHSTLSHF